MKIRLHVINRFVPKPVSRVLDAPMMLALLLSVSPVSCTTDRPQPAANPLKDKPYQMPEDRVPEFDRAIAPYVAKAKRTYPAARNRYLAGLPAGHVFYLTTRLRDPNGKWEVVFIKIESIKDGQATGTIANDLGLVAGFIKGQSYAFPETDMIDWTIVRPDGSEEGNVVGKFLDTHKL